jgi:hypothetical protein
MATRTVSEIQNPSLIEALAKVAEAMQRITSARRDTKSESRVRTLNPVHRNEPRRTLAAPASLAANWRQAFFSCGKAGFFCGGCVAASGSVKSASAMILRKIFRRFAFVR